MSGDLSESIAIITRIQDHFLAQGWQPLLQVKVNGLTQLSLEKLQRLQPKVLAATDRMSAVTVILEAVIPGNDPSPDEKPELSDSAVLRLRLNQPM